ncbi:MAG: hypothetical protein ACKVT0_11655, partial [Planctomycetaceae bacterium]
RGKADAMLTLMRGQRTTSYDRMYVRIESCVPEDIKSVSTTTCNDVKTPKIGEPRRRRNMH